jgi:hypothetical protein
MTPFPLAQGHDLLASDYDPVLGLGQLEAGPRLCGKSFRYISNGSLDQETASLGKDQNLTRGRFLGEIDFHSIPPASMDFMALPHSLSTLAGTRSKP